MSNPFTVQTSEGAVLFLMPLYRHVQNREALEELMTVYFRSRDKVFV